jgi:hypothetical protein
MRLTSLVTLSAALLLSSTAMAQDKKLASNEQAASSVGNQAADETKAPAPTEKKICKRLATSGTRMAERVCLTKQHWEKVDEESN